MSDNKIPMLVLGGTGKTGRRVAALGRRPRDFADYPRAAAATRVRATLEGDDR